MLWYELTYFNSINFKISKTTLEGGTKCFLKWFASETSIKIMILKNTDLIKIKLENKNFSYEIENVCRIFFPNCKVFFVDCDNFLSEYENFICIKLDNSQSNTIIISVYANINGKTNNKTAVISQEKISDKDIELKICVLIFKILSEITTIKPKWGILTGVRPIKLFHSLSVNNGIKYSMDYFRTELLVSDEKINLAKNIEENQNEFLKASDKKSFSLYVSIPFCPSRCAYCSFVSQSVEKSIKLIPNYLELLKKELIYTAKIVNRLDLKLESIYVGGGTPTVLEPSQLKALIDTVLGNFDMTFCQEFTIEAGRPDTITQEKLEVLKSFNDIRVSINPQTFNDSVLKIIGRRHTSEETIRAFEMARRAGISNINMDLIAGLPSDDFISFRKTVQKALEMEPESITLHTLSVKRASNIFETGNDIYKSTGEIDKMLNFAYTAFSESGYKPYYLYRQSKMLGNTENTGWAQKGFEGVYNIYIMEELHSIIACGAGAVTKLKSPIDNKIERIFNFKFSYEYINRFDEIIKRKDKVKNFYEEFQ